MASMSRLSSSSEVMTAAAPKLLEVGRVSRSHGLTGEVVVDLTTDRHERVEAGSVLNVGGRPLTVAESRPFGHRFLVRFVGVDSREAADKLHGAVIRAEALDDPEALWVHEVVGAELFEADGTSRGLVVAVQSNPAADLLVLDSGSLVPVTFVVSFSDHRVTIDAPPGLFDLL